MITTSARSDKISFAVRLKFHSLDVFMLYLLLAYTKPLLDHDRKYGVHFYLSLEPSKEWILVKELLLLLEDDKTDNKKLYLWLKEYYSTIFQLQINTLTFTKQI